MGIIDMTSTKKSQKPKLNPTSKHLPGALGVLQILLKEVLQQTSAERAANLIEGIQNGRNLRLIIGESAAGRYKKCAFQWSFHDDQEWRGLPETKGTA
jgi:hypothetical protein